MGRNNPHWPHRDERSFNYENHGYRRRNWYGPYRRQRWRIPKRPTKFFRTVIGVLALIGAISLGGIFVALVNKLSVSGRIHVQGFRP
jgi:hypothetical protein